MFGNNDEFFLYGLVVYPRSAVHKHGRTLTYEYLYRGLSRPTNSQYIPKPRDVLGYQVYNAASGSTPSNSAFFNTSLPANMTQYVTNGAGVSIPSESLGFYFSGLRGADWGAIALYDGSANTLANTLISVDMKEQQSADWRNNSLFDYILPRADAALVWVPVSKRGVLAVIGGVVNAEILSVTGLSDAQVTQDVRLSMLDRSCFRTVDSS